MSAYYNEFEPYAAEWLRNLIKKGLIADGEVDGRSIVDVRPDDLRGFTQCHFFAGIGVWSYALRLAGWPDDRQVWTGSCPCQPFSAAGKGRGFEDERHLWPAWFRLIEACRPPVIFGEQVASAEVVGKTAKSRGRQTLRDSLPTATSSPRPGAPRGTPSAAEGDFLRSMGSPVGIAGEDRCGQVRGDGSAAEFAGWQDMGQPIARSHRPSKRLHLLEHARCLSWREQRNGRLGRAEAGRDGESYLGHAEAEIERLIAGFGGAAEGEAPEPWLDAVFHDLERIGYAAGAHVLPACGVGAPHIRQRLWFVGERLAHSSSSGGRTGLCDSGSAGERRHITADGLGACGLGHYDHQGLEGQRRGHQAEGGWLGAAGSVAEAGEPRGLADPMHAGWSEGRASAGDRQASGSRCDSRPSPTNGHWRAADWLHCRDGRWRPVEPGTFPLAHGAAARVGRLRAYGNAIVPQVAAEVIGAFMEVTP